MVPRHSCSACHNSCGASLASAHEIRATATSRYRDERRCGVTSSCHWNRLNVSNHTDGPNKNAGAKLREYGARQKDRPIAATVKRKLLTKGKQQVRKNTGFRSSEAICRRVGKATCPP